MRDGPDPPAEPALAPPLAIVVKGWPRLSETFIAREVLALEKRGLRLALWSLRHPTDRKRHPMVASLAAAVTYLPEYLWQEPARVWRGWRAARALPGYRAARRQWLADWRRDPTPNRGRRFGQALVLAAELPEATRHIHAQFLHTPSSVARYAAMMRGLTWSASAHAKDVWTTPAWEKREKLADASFVVTCTHVGCTHLADLAPPAKVELLYHGLAPDDFPDPGARVQARDARDAADPVRILSVGRAVPKKGYDVLIDALALLPRDLHWRLVHIGGGVLRDDLKQRAERAGIAARIDWRGAGAADEVLAAYRDADLFVLPSKIAADGDRDGMPNVLMEAMSQRLPCIASAVSAIPELIASADAGVLVPPDDPAALAAALARLIGDPATRTSLGAAGNQRVRAAFSFAHGIDQLVARLDAVAIRPSTIQPCASSSTRR
jgi:glycosyltransferase involved in cell wall biosynthesis